MKSQGIIYERNKGSFVGDLSHLSRQYHQQYSSANNNNSYPSSPSEDSNVDTEALSLYDSRSNSRFIIGEKTDQHVNNDHKIKTKSPQNTLNTVKPKFKKRINTKKSKNLQSKKKRVQDKKNDSTDDSPSYNKYIRNSSGNHQSSNILADLEDKKGIFGNELVVRYLLAIVAGIVVFGFLFTQIGIILT